MIASLSAWFKTRSWREQILLAVMGALFAIVILIFAIILPLNDGIAAARERLDRATIEAGQVEARLALLDTAKRAPVSASGGPIATVVSTAASDAGFTLERANPQGEDRVAIAIPAAKSQALFGWLNGLQTRGIFAETISIRRNPDSSLAVEATLRRRLP